MVIIALTKLWASRFIKKLIYIFFFYTSTVEANRGRTSPWGSHCWGGESEPSNKIKKETIKSDHTFWLEFKSPVKDCHENAIYMTN